MVTTTKPENPPLQKLTWLSGGLSAGSELYVLTGGTRRSAMITRPSIQFSDPIKDEVCVRIYDSPQWTNLHLEFEQWMEATFGVGGRNRRHSWRKNHVRFGVYYVRGESNLTLVKLRWSEYIR